VTRRVGILLGFVLWADCAALQAQTVLETDDGLRIEWIAPGGVGEITIRDQPLPLTGQARVFVRDENERSAWIPADGVASREPDGSVRIESDLSRAQLRVSTRWTAQPGYIHAEATAEDLSGRDRALSIAFRMPVRTEDCVWWRDMRRSEVAKEGQEYLLLTSASGAGARGRLSVYPFSAASWPERFGVSIGVPADQPRDYVMGIDQAGNLFIEFYVGLTRDTAKFPGWATVEWIIYQHDPAWGFRDAVRRYQEFYPRHFHARSPQGGAWLCGLTASEIDTPDNERLLGSPASRLFRYHLLFSGIKEEAARQDDELGLVTVPFTIALAKLRYRPQPSLEGIDGLGLLNRVGTPGFDGRLQTFWRGKEAVLNSMLWDADGRAVLEGSEAASGPDLRTVQFPVNADPDLFAHDERHAATAARRLFDGIENTLNAMPSMDGYYFDFVSTINGHLNHRREHFAWADFPATFAHDSGAVVLHNRFGIHEFLRELRRRFDDPEGPLAGKLLWANGMKMFQGGTAFEAFLVDVVGFEWSMRPNWHDILSFDFARVVAGRKPVVHTCNVRPPALGAKLKPEEVPMWYRRMVLLGIPPIVREAFSSPECLESHAELIRLYVPIANRLQTAGWHPVPHARADRDGIWIERFGRVSDGSLHLAVYNSMDRPMRVTLECCSTQLEISRTAVLSVYDMCGNVPVPAQRVPDGKDIHIPLELEAHGLAVLRFDISPAGQ
jgi:hypothetical protein